MAAAEPANHVFRFKMSSQFKYMHPSSRMHCKSLQGSLEVDVKAEEADEAAAAQPVDRLILAVHGIGQKLSGANIVDDAAALRALVRRFQNDEVFHE